MSGQGDGGGSGEEIVFKARVASILEAELKRKVKGIWFVIGAFLGGLALFIGAGLTWKENLLRPIVESIYPASYISDKVKAQLLEDQEFRELLITEEHKLAIAAQITRITSEHVDSGYTRNIVFSQSASGDDSVLTFYARKEQEVELTIIARAPNGSQTKFRIVVDRRAWGEPRKFPYTMVQGNITEHLRFDAEPGGNLHTMRFVPIDFTESDRAVIECVVLVRNPSS